MAQIDKSLKLSNCSFQSYLDFTQHASDNTDNNGNLYKDQLLQNAGFVRDSMQQKSHLS